MDEYVKQEYNRSRLQTWHGYTRHLSKKHGFLVADSLIKAVGSYSYKPETKEFSQSFVNIKRHLELI